MTRPHRGILINKIPVAFVPGLIFAVGVTVIFLIGFPGLILPYAVCIILGTALAFLRRWWLDRT
ncbi:MAG TPA: hypothetical protein VLV83_27180 [Acidobacteriota bacterium]|nr:hypothetical protein [Acidobacteriota bacterium]